ncbi:MAG TPA: DUF6069 family protein, partial [Dermatophilaceae bacterium]
RMSTHTARLPIVGAAVLVAFGVNLALYELGRAAGGSFTYIQSGNKTTVDALAVTIMSVGPLVVGLGLVACLAPRWPRLITAAKIAAPMLALATIALMTVPAHFDTTSTIFLASMHLALIPISLLAIAALDQRHSSLPARPRATAVVRTSRATDSAAKRQ